MKVRSYVEVHQQATCLLRRSRQFSSEDAGSAALSQRARKSYFSLANNLATNDKRCVLGGHWEGKSLYWEYASGRGRRRNFCHKLEWVPFHFPFAVRSIQQPISGDTPASGRTFQSNTVDLLRLHHDTLDFWKTNLPRQGRTGSKACP